MLHFLQDCLFHSDSPLHHDFLSSPQKCIAERNASQESKWFPHMSHDLLSLLSAVSEVQAKHVELQQ